MDVLISALEGIRAAAPTLGRGEIDAARRDATVLQAAVGIAQERATDVFHPAPHRDAVDRCLDAIEQRRDALQAEAVRLIQALPSDRPARSILRPVHDRAMALSTLRLGATEVTASVRERGERVQGTIDTFVPGVATETAEVEAYAVHVDQRAGTVSIDGLGLWSLQYIVAASADDGVAFLLDNGVLVDVREAA